MAATIAFNFPLIISACSSSTSSLPLSHTNSRAYSSSSFIGTVAIGVAVATSAFVVPDAALSASSSLIYNEPSNALSLPTWVIHVSSVVEWVTAMILVWEYGDKSGFESWKGLSWGMVKVKAIAVDETEQVQEYLIPNSQISDVNDIVFIIATFCLLLLSCVASHRIKSHIYKVPLLGGALCACTWHFFYNSEELEVLVALQAALTVIGNLTMCVAAFRIFKASQETSKRS